MTFVIIWYVLTILDQILNLRVMIPAFQLLLWFTSSYSLWQGIIAKIIASRLEDYYYTEFLCKGCFAGLDPRLFPVNNYCQCGGEVSNFFALRAPVWPKVRNINIL